MNLTPHPTWEIKDSSKLSTYLDCKRKYFYEYILGWRPDVPAHDLHFGQAWHHAREYMLLNGYDDIQGAYLAFINHYREKFHEETDSIYIPKTPTAVGLALLQFHDTYKRDLIDNELLSTEMSGTVPVDSKRVLYYRLDSILRNKQSGKIFSWDHKTTSESYMSYKSWEMQFYMAIQNFTYTHCLYCMYPIEEVMGVEFCGTGFGFLKRGSAKSPPGPRIAFKRVPAFRSPEQMNVGLWTVVNLLDDLEREMDHLYHCKESDSVLTAFPINPGSCTKYRGCPFYDYCLSWPNPLRQCQEPPLGYRTEWWDPSAMETTNKRNLEWNR